VKLEEIVSDRPRKFSGTENQISYRNISITRWPKKFFEQFHTIATDEAHGAKAKTILSILENTFGFAYSRFGYLYLQQMKPVRY
jgi:hypothetical protein